MFTWFHRWRLNRHRAIFRFWDGRTYRRVDPLVAFRALREHPTFEIERDLTGHDAGQEDSTQACLAATRVAFGVVPFDGSGNLPLGLTEAETIDLLATFGNWTQAVKKNISPSLTSSPITTAEPPSCMESATAAMSNSADSHSMPDAPSCAAPDLLPTA